MNKINSRSGFSLLEIVISIAVSGIVITGTVVGLATAARVNAHAKQDLADQVAVQSVVEKLLANGYEGSGSTTYPEATVTPENTEHPSYYEVTVTRGDISITTKVKNVTPTPTPVPEQ